MAATGQIRPVLVKICPSGRPDKNGLAADIE